MSDDAFRDYETLAESLIAKFEAISSPDLYAPVLDHLPTAPARVLDVGAGTGRDAAWLSALGHHVTAVEPVRTFVDAGQALHTDIALWIEDSLPDLTSLIHTEQTYDCILLTAVWHHLDAEQQKRSAKTIARLLAKGGRLILSIRHDGTTDRAAQTRRATTCAEDAGLACLFQSTASSQQQDNLKAGVLWTWAVFGHTT